MKLIVMPQVASGDGGYSIVVRSDYDKLQPKAGEDLVIWYATESPNDRFRDEDVVVIRPHRYALKRFTNVLQGKPSSELLASELPDIEAIPDTIFCGDTVVYRALRAKFPKAKLQVRFHNCFYRIYERVKDMGMTTPWRYRQLMSSMTRLEKIVFADKNMEPIFLCTEDLEFYEEVTGRRDSKLWNVPVNISERPENPEFKSINHLVWFGGLDTHKKSSVDHFITEVYPGIKEAYPDLTFELYGGGTEAYNDPDLAIHGHGRHPGDDFPHATDGLYINPDLTGGGVKIKVQSYFEAYLRFLTTPFGFEGYPRELVDEKFCWMEPMQDWKHIIPQIIEDSRR